MRISPVDHGNLASVCVCFPAGDAALRVRERMKYHRREPIVDDTDAGLYVEIDVLRAEKILRGGTQKRGIRRHFVPFGGETASLGRPGS